MDVHRGWHSVLFHHSSAGVDYGEKTIYLNNVFELLHLIFIFQTNTLLMLLVLKRYFERKPLLVKAATANSTAANNQHQQQQNQQHQHHHPRYHLNSIRPSLRASIILLPFFSFNWFLSVLSLETLSTSPFELIFAFTNCLHAFLVFYYHCYQRYSVSLIHLF